MNPVDPQQNRWFRSQPNTLLESASRIDAEAGIIYDVVMVQEGEAKGHGVNLEGDFIDAIVAYDKKYHSKQGLKARFGHPGASSETMGTQMGYFKNFRGRQVDGLNQAIADLYLLEAANESPTHPGMRDWVLKMAEERPDFMMSSIVFQPSGYYQRDENGKKVKARYDYEDGEWVGAFPGEPVYVDFDEKKGAKHMYTDLVEAGAATENLFSNKVNTHLYAAQVDEFLNEHPHLTEFLKSNPDAVSRWLARAGYSVSVHKQKKMSKFSIRAWLLGEQQPEDPAAPTVDDLNDMRTSLSEARSEIQSLRAERDSWKEKFEAATQRATELAAEAKSLRESVEQLTAQVKELTARLAIVGKTPAAESTGGEPEAFESKTKGIKWAQFKAQNNIK